MSLPKAVKITKNGVVYESNVDRLQYTLKELERAALRDTGKYICNRTRKKIKRRTGRLAKNTQYWVRSKQPVPDLQVGFKPGGFYGLYQEVGTKEQKKIGALSDATQSNLSEIKKIQSQYLSGLGDESAEALIDEGDYQGE